MKTRLWMSAALTVPMMVTCLGAGGVAAAAPSPGHEVELVNATVITEVTPVGNMVTGVALEYDGVVHLGGADIEESAFEVAATLINPSTGAELTGSRSVVEAYTNSAPEYSDAQQTGRYVILELNEDDALAGSTYNDGRTQFYDLVGAYEVEQVAAVVTRAHTVPAQNPITNENVVNLIVDDYATEEFVSSTGRQLPFRFFSPDVKGKRQFPLVVSLHGYGESGTNNFSQVAGNQLSTAFADPARQEDSPAFVLSPQANPGGTSSGAWWDSAMQAAVVELVENTIAENPAIDPDRVYVTGLSMGSYGSWGILKEHSDLFAGALLICGAGGANNVDALVEEVADLPIWAVHSIDDAVVSYTAPGSDFRIFEALEAAGTAVTWTAWDADLPESGHEALALEAVATATAENSDHIFTTYNAGTTLWGAHGSWVPVYNNDVMLDWLFSQSRA